MSVNKQINDIERRNKEQAARVDAIIDNLKLVKRFSNYIKSRLKVVQARKCPIWWILLTLVVGLIIDIILFYEFF